MLFLELLPRAAKGLADVCVEAPPKRLELDAAAGVAGAAWVNGDVFVTGGWNDFGGSELDVGLFGLRIGI